MFLLIMVEVTSVLFALYQVAKFLPPPDVTRVPPGEMAEYVARRSRELDRETNAGGRSHYRRQALLKMAASLAVGALCIYYIVLGVP